MSVYEILEESVHFPSCKATQSVHVLSEANLPSDLREYLSVEPTKQRQVGSWTWDAPENIRRSPDEPGYSMAIKDQGMGHFDLLYWNHETDHWVTVPMGGSNHLDCDENFKRWMSNKVTGVESTLEEQMDLCLKDQMFSRRK